MEKKSQTPKSGDNQSVSFDFFKSFYMKVDQVIVTSHTKSCYTHCLIKLDLKRGFLSKKSLSNFRNFTLYLFYQPKIPSLHVHGYLLILQTVQINYLPEQS